MKILFVGDIVGEPGRKAVAANLDRLVDQHRIDLVIANGENAAGGFGITPRVAEDLFAMGIHVLTSGNHIWDKKEILDYFPHEPRLLRPANYPDGVPGQGTYLFTSNMGEKVAILNLMGRVFMPNLDCPFRVGEAIVARLREETSVVIVDMHAEATSEKTAMGWYLDGRVSAVIGTHTHVQTADEQILPQGTAYITDVGMVGPVRSVIGVKREQVLSRFLTQMPRRFETASGPTFFCAVVLDVDSQSGRTRAIQRLRVGP